MNYSRQSLSDRLQAARHTLMGSALGRGVCKATTEELGAPKKKHLDYLQQCTYEANVSVPQLVELLIDRTRSTSWVVTFKALITIHYLLNNGNERFGSCFASCGHKLNLSKFFDRSSLIGFEMSAYIRKYASYIDSKRDTHRAVGHDLCRVKRGKEDGFLRKLPTDKLFRILNLLNNPIDALTQFTLSKSEMMNSIIATVCRLLCKDAIRLYACYNDGIINLLEKFFDLNKKECAEALELYRGFLSRSENLAAFLKSAESCGIDRASFPELIKAPGSLLEALENHLQGLEGDQTQLPKISQRPPNFDSELIAFSKSCNHSEQQASEFNNEEKRLALEDEAKAMSEFNKLKRSSDVAIGIQSANEQQRPDNSLTRDLLDLNFGWDAAPPVNQPTEINGKPASGRSDNANTNLTAYQSNPFTDATGFSPVSLPIQPTAPLGDLMTGDKDKGRPVVNPFGGFQATNDSLQNKPPSATFPVRTNVASTPVFGATQPSSNPFLDSTNPLSANFNQSMPGYPFSSTNRADNTPSAIDWLS